MADIIFTECNKDGVNWPKIVGLKTLDDGGYFGDIMTLGRVHIEDAKSKGELTEQDAGNVYGTLIQTAIQQAVQFELTEALREMEICKTQADVDETKNKSERELCVATADCALKEEQRKEIPKESARKDCKVQAECEFLRGQKDKLECDCKNDTNMTDSKISLNAAQENKLACDCCNASKLAVADVRLKAKQEELYVRQAAGFDDNAYQKLYEAQLNAWSMVFMDTSAEVVTPSISDPYLCDSYDRLKRRFDGVDTGGQCAAASGLGGDTGSDDGSGSVVGPSGRTRDQAIAICNGAGYAVGSPEWENCAARCFYGGSCP